MHNVKHAHTEVSSISSTSILSLLVSPFPIPSKHMPQIPLAIIVLKPSLVPLTVTAASLGSYEVAQVAACKWLTITSI